MEQNPATIRIERPLYEHEQLRQNLSYEVPKESFLKSCCEKKDTSFQSILTNIIPAIGWIPKYEWKQDFLPDLISGFTVAVMHIPQGMAYALLGNLHPVVGIYMAFFPVIIYFFLGTSRHTSMGTFAIICLMTGKVVLEHSHHSYFPKNELNLTTTENPLIESVHTLYSPIEVATTVTFTVALFQLLMYAFRLGAISALLSETLVSGFTTGAAVLVCTSQIKDLFGLHIPRHKGYFVIINTFSSIFQELSNVNYAALTIAAVTIVVTSMNNELIKPVLAKRTPFPVPIELIVVIIGTLVSYYCNLHEVYHVSILGEIPSGLPEPSVPPFALIPHIIFDAFTIAVVSYTVTLSMGLIFAQRFNYEVDANQELLAMGSGNIFGSFFSCMPVSASLSRSSIQQTVGGKTQIASVVSCGILIFVLLYIGPLFEPLPKSVLAGVIVVSLKGMLMQVTTFFKFLKLSKLDALVWMVTFLTVVFVSIDIGLLVGVLMSLLSIFVLGLKPYSSLLGSVPQTDLYLDINRYKGTHQIQGIKIFHYCGGINFATRNMFKSELLRLVAINPQMEIIYRKKLTKYAQKIEDTEDKTYIQKIAKVTMKMNTEVKCLIIDFSSLSYIDPSGVNMLLGLFESFQKINIPVYVAACSDHVYEMMKKCDLIDSTKISIRIFTTVHDAVQSALEIFNATAESSSATIS